MSYLVRLCPRNHEIRGENVYIIRRSNGVIEQRCKKCTKERQRSYDERKRQMRLSASA